MRRRQEGARKAEAEACKVPQLERENADLRKMLELDSFWTNFRGVPTASAEDPSRSEGCLEVRLAETF